MAQDAWPGMVIGTSLPRIRPGVLPHKALTSVLDLDIPPLTTNMDSLLVTITTTTQLHIIQVIIIVAMMSTQQIIKALRKFVQTKPAKLIHVNNCHIIIITIQEDCGDTTAKFHPVCVVDKTGYGK